MSKKRKSSALAENRASSLSEALILVEKLRKPVSLGKACETLPKLGDFRPAKVLLASKVPQKVIDFDSYDEEKAMAISESERNVLKELDALTFLKSCRSSLGRHKKSSEILAVCKPIMKKVPNPKKLSQISNALEIILSYTVVAVDSDINEWFAFETWFENKLCKVPLFSEITDPVLLFIRGNNGGAQPAGLEAVLTGIQTGGDPRDGCLSQAPVLRPQRPGVGQARIPDLYEFANRYDMGIAIAVLRSWATQNGHVLDFSYVVTNHGLVFM